jgi:D-alanine-D-alanine ligase-like ATP-grasp enzyme
MKSRLFFNKKECLYCGANQVSHAMTWFDATFAVKSGPYTERLMKSYIGKILCNLVDWILVSSVKLWIFLKMAKYSKDGSKIKLGRAKVLFEEAKRRGMEIEHVVFLGMPSDVFRVKLQGKWFYFSSLPRKNDYSNPSLAWMDDKAILKERLSRAGVPTPKGGSVKTIREAYKIFDSIEKPVIVKPRIGSRGRHTTTHIYTKEELASAFHVAKKMCRYVIVEEHLEGAVYRGTIIDLELRGVLGGEPPKVFGDGEKTIRELVREKNETKDTRISDVRIHRVLEDFLARLGYTLDTILPKGEELYLSEKIGVSYGGKSIEVTENIHPKLKEILEHAGRVVDDPILGFDFIISDVTSDPSMQRWGIIECNAVPFINLHHSPLIGTPKNIAGHVWDSMQK